MNMQQSFYPQQQQQAAAYYYNQYPMYSPAMNNWNQADNNHGEPNIDNDIDTSNEACSHQCCYGNNVGQLLASPYNPPQYYYHMFNLNPQCFNPHQMCTNNSTVVANTTSNDGTQFSEQHRTVVRNKFTSREQTLIRIPGVNRTKTVNITESRTWWKVKLNPDNTETSKSDTDINAESYCASSVGGAGTPLRRTSSDEKNKLIILKKSEENLSAENTGSENILYLIKGVPIKNNVDEIKKIAANNLIRKSSVSTVNGVPSKTKSKSQHSCATVAGQVKDMKKKPSQNKLTKSLTSTSSKKSLKQQSTSKKLNASSKQLTNKNCAPQKVHNNNNNNNNKVDSNRKTPAEINNTQQIYSEKLMEIKPIKRRSVINQYCKGILSKFAMNETSNDYLKRNFCSPRQSHTAIENVESLGRDLELTMQFIMHEMHSIDATKNYLSLKLSPRQKQNLAHLIIDEMNELNMPSVYWGPVCKLVIQTLNDDFRDYFTNRQIGALIANDTNAWLWMVELANSI